ncbi:MAG: SRPBCC domain-containing protein [Chthoniobacterales bacterium]|nr:SRPBCC domain-containing protein [Chthoniobacterales bacterium]
MSDIDNSAAELELVSARVLNAARERVFRAFAEPEHLARWWGPDGFRSTIHSFDFQPGGRWELTLHGPDGTDYENEYFAVEIREPERIVISHPEPAHEFRLIVLLSNEGENKTRLSWRQIFSSREHFAEVKQFVAEANEQVLDRLEAEVARIA